MFVYVQSVRVSVDVVVCEDYLFSVCKCAHSRIYVHVATLSPVHNAVSVEGHKVDLTAATRTHGRKKHLKEKKVTV